MSRTAGDHCHTASRASSAAIGTTGRRHRPASAQATIGPPTSAPRRTALPPIAVGTTIARDAPSAYSTAAYRSVRWERGSTIRQPIANSGIGR